MLQTKCRTTENTLFYATFTENAKNLKQKTEKITNESFVACKWTLNNV